MPNLHYVDLTLDSSDFPKIDEWQFHIINVQRRMADWSFEKAHTWEDLLAAHEKWMRDYNFQRHLAHEKRNDERHSPAAVLGWIKEMQPEPDLVYHVFSALCETRTLTKVGYAKFSNFLLYGEQGLAGKKALINIFQDVLTLEYGEHPLSRYSVEWQPDDTHLNAQLLYREMEEQGYPGESSAVGRFIAPWWALKGEARSFKSVEPKPELMIHPDEGKKKRPPTALQVAHWITFKEEQRLDWQKAYLARLCQDYQEIAQTYELIQGLTTMLRERQGDELDSWLKVVKEQGVAELQSFAQGLERDYDAVKAGLTLHWSQGSVEGHVHRLKLIKRQAYGRTSFDQLRKRVLHCA